MCAANAIWGHWQLLSATSPPWPEQCCVQLTPHSRPLLCVAITATRLPHMIAKGYKGNQLCRESPVTEP